MPPTLIRETLWFGLMLSSSLPLWLTVKSAVQPRPSARASRILALRLNSIPRFLMVPTLVVRRFVKLVPAATGTVKIRSLVFLVYQSMAPLIR